jgi:hypothetical protein
MAQNQNSNKTSSRTITKRALRNMLYTKEPRSSNQKPKPKRKIHTTLPIKRTSRASTRSIIKKGEGGAEAEVEAEVEADEEEGPPTPPKKSV